MAQSIEMPQMPENRSSYHTPKKLFKQQQQKNQYGRVFHTTMLIEIKSQQLNYGINRDAHQLLTG